MAWNQPGEDKKRPPPRGAPPDESSLDEMLRRWQQRVQRLWRPGRGGGVAALVLVLIALAMWLGSGYYQITSTERGVVQRFGRYVSIEQPGRGWHWPWPIESITKLPIAGGDSVDNKALMLTSEQSLVDVNWSVQYRIDDPLQYLFQLVDPPATLRQVSESVLRELIAARSVQELVLGGARAQVTADARDRIQHMLNDYHSGISVTGISLPEVQMPDAVVATQRDAEKAAEERQRNVADARAYANDILPKAHSSALRQLTDADVYAKATVATADGEADRFSQLAEAFTAAPDLTRNRMYIDTIEGILKSTRKVIIDAKTGSGGSVLYLPLDKFADALRAPAAGSAASSGGAATPNGTAAAGAANANAGADHSDGDDRGRDRSDR